MAKKKSAHSHQTHLNGALPIIAVLSVIVVALFLITQTQKNLEMQNQAQQAVEQRLKLLSQGINPDPVSVRQLPLDYRWESQPFSYHTRNVYLTPDIADFGPKRDELKIGVENKFLVVEVDIAYVKNQGAKQDINVNRVVRVMANGKAYQPVSADTVKLGPDQNSTSYVIFAVPMTTSEFSVTTGNKVTRVDFRSPSVSTMQGVFTTTSGYQDSL